MPWYSPLADTYRLSLSAISNWSNVAWALQRTLRGKHRLDSVQTVLRNPEALITEVSAALRAGRLPVGTFRPFTIHDPKRRIIHAAPLADRVAHHALMRLAEPRLERALLSSVFACRVGKGVHSAVAYAQRQARRFTWVMHMDIAQFFPNVDHDILRGQLRRRFRGDGMALLDAAIAAYGGDAGKGLPIGALTSQHFANHYLSQADRWCLRQPGIAAHCRYMDDFLLWANDRRALQECVEGVSRILEERFGLEIKPVTIRRTDGGILFCGTHIWPFRLRPSQRRRKHYRQALAHWQQQWLIGAIDSLELQQAYAACRAILLPADDLAWRKHCLTRIKRVDA